MVTENLKRQLTAILSVAKFMNRVLIGEGENETRQSWKPPAARQADDGCVDGKPPAPTPENCDAARAKR
jgi:hypothetical protein